jgi:hypothetical protein
MPLVSAPVATSADVTVGVLVEHRDLPEQGTGDGLIIFP